MKFIYIIRLYIKNDKASNRDRNDSVLTSEIITVLK